MTERLLSIFDNGADTKTRGKCDDCGASLRYEYQTTGGIYGSECINAHIHRPDWMTLRAKKDAQRWANIQHSIECIHNSVKDLDEIVYIEYRDKSVSIRDSWVWCLADAKRLYIDNLIAAGWTNEEDYSPSFGAMQYKLHRPEEAK